MITKNERYKKAIPEAIIHTSSELVSVAVLFSRDSILYAAVGNYMNPPPPKKNVSTHSGIICNAAVITSKLTKSTL